MENQPRPHRYWEAITDM